MPPQIPAGGSIILYIKTVINEFVPFVSPSNYYSVVIN